MFTENYQFKQRTTHHKRSQQDWQNNNCRVIVRSFQDLNLPGIFMWHLKLHFLFLKIRKVTHFKKTSCSQAILQNETTCWLSLQKHACMWCEYMNVVALCFHRTRSLTWTSALVVDWQTHLHFWETKPGSGHVRGFYHWKQFIKPAIQEAKRELMAFLKSLYFFPLQAHAAYLLYYTL